MDTVWLTLLQFKAVFTIFNWADEFVCVCVFLLDIHSMDLQPSVWSHSGKEKKISTTGYNEALPYH